MSRIPRALEFMIAVTAFVALSPVIGTGAVLIYCHDRGPLIHRRRIVGRHGRPFDAFKLRTMRVDADHWLSQQPELLERFQTRHKLDNDPRVTPIGRTLRRLSIDELPQLVNVLRGEMSLVGPRMFHESELASYGEAAAEILAAAPGMTGLWQVSGRQELDRAERVRLDLEYVRRCTLRLDLIILLKTIPAALGGRGAR